MTAVHRTDPANVVASAWLPLDAEVEVAYLIDAAHTVDGDPMFARLDYAGAVAAAERLGGRLIDRAELEDLRRKATVLEPYTQPISATFEAAERHDREVWRRIKAAGASLAVLILGIGKQWIAGAPDGRAHLMGWWTANLAKYGPRTGAGWVQQPSATGAQGPHDSSHVDYSSITIVVRKRAAKHDAPPSLLSMLAAAGRRIATGLVDMVRIRPSLGALALDVARIEQGKGIRELPGAAHHPAIQAYHSGARRGGPPTAGYLGVSAPVVLGDKAADETEWCASSASWCMSKVLRDGDKPPHGWRCSVREIVEDARALGTLRLVSEGYEPRPGDLAIQERVNGESPLRGGRGHVARVAEVGSGGVLTLGGNEGNTWNYTHHARPFKRIVAWVVC